MAIHASGGRLGNIIALSLIFMLVVTFPLHPASAAVSASRTGIMIPLYTYPGSTWANVIAVQKANPGVPIVAIINPNSGPGTSIDPNYASGILSLQSAGVVVLGYVPTGYASRSIAAVQSMVSDYKSWYPVNGIFLDEMSNIGGHESYYSTLNAYAKSLGFTYTVGNPGADTLASYIGTVDTIVVYENQGLPSLSYLGGWHSGFAKSNFAMMAYGVQSVNQSYPSTASPHVGYIYITDAGLPNPYDVLPPYLAAIASALATAPVTATHPTFPINVASVSLSGSPITGSWTVVQANGSTVAEGFAPLVFTASLGASYTISVATYGHYVFDHWSDGSSDRVRTVTADGAMTLSAYYQLSPRMHGYGLITIN